MVIASARTEAPRARVTPPRVRRRAGFAYVENLRAQEAEERARPVVRAPGAVTAYEYETVDRSARSRPGVRVSWANKIAFLAGGGKDGRLRGSGSKPWPRRWLLLMFAGGTAGRRLV